MTKPLDNLLQDVSMESSAADFPALHLPSADWRRLKDVNVRWNENIVKHRAVVLEVYRPLARRADKSGVVVSPNLSYGGDPRQCLDVFTPAGADDQPVLMFVHGGAFTRGSKSVDGDIYDNVLYWFAGQGFVGVNVEYRLAPGSRFPAGAQDVGLAVEWVRNNIRRHGGDPNKIVLMGHSAGGCHVASYLLDPEVGVTTHAGIKAVVLASARLRLETRPDNPNARNVAAYCGDDQAVLDRCSPVSYVEYCRWPVFIAIAEHENRHLDSYGLEFASRLAMARGCTPRLVRMLGHNHTSIVAHFNTGEDWLGRQILAFLKPYISPGAQ